GADKGMPGQVLGIPRLLADKHDPDLLRPLAEDGLRRVAVQRAGGAFGRRLAQLVERRLVWDQPSRARLLGVVGFGHRSRPPIGMTIGRPTFPFSGGRTPRMPLT